MFMLTVLKFPNVKNPGYFHFYVVKHTQASIKQSPVLKGHLLI